MALVIDRYLPDKQIEARAAQLLQQYGRRYTAIARPPVPVEKIAEFIADVTILYDAIPNHGAASILAKLVVTSSRRLIVINTDKEQFFAEHEGVEEYSLAHELGHWTLHVDQASLLTTPLATGEERAVELCRKTDTGWDRREWQAERFAAYLLMPEDLIRRACAGLDLLQWPVLYQLRAQFHVSITALKRRLTELHLVMVTTDGELAPYHDTTMSQSPSLWE